MRERIAIVPRSWPAYRPLVEIDGFVAWARARAGIDAGAHRAFLSEVCREAGEGPVLPSHVHAVLDRYRDSGRPDSELAACKRVGESLIAWCKSPMGRASLRSWPSLLADWGSIVVAIATVAAMAAAVVMFPQRHSLLGRHVLSLEEWLFLAFATSSLLLSMTDLLNHNEWLRERLGALAQKFAFARGLKLPRLASLVAAAVSLSIAVALLPWHRVLGEKPVSASQWAHTMPSFSKHLGIQVTVPEPWKRDASKDSRQVVDARHWAVAHYLHRGSTMLIATSESDAASTPADLVEAVTPLAKLWATESGLKTETRCQASADGNKVSCSSGTLFQMTCVPRDSLIGCVARESGNAELAGDMVNRIAASMTTHRLEILPPGP